MTDQQRFDSTGASGSEWMQTPNIDRIASEGVDFSECFCAAPSCVPSRASFFTCMYPHEIGVFHNGDAWTPSWVNLFKDAGYHTVNIGKMHTVPIDQTGGFDQRYIVENKDRPLKFEKPHGVFLDEWDKFLNNSGKTKPGRQNYRDHHPLYETSLGAYDWELEERYHSDVFVGTMAEWFLDQRKAETPLFLQIGFPGPHPPFDPPKRWVEMYKDVEIPVPKLSKQEYALQPTAHKRYRNEMINGNHDAVRWQDIPDHDQLLRLRRYYAANVSLIDSQVGRVIDALDRNGYLDNCLILFTSDHGDCLGDHGHIQKWTMYDQVVKVPAYLWGPGILPRTGRVDGMIQQMDLAPLLFSMAGIPIEIPPLCRSAEPVLTGRDTGRPFVFAEHGQCNMLPNIERMSMIRSKQWKLVEYRNQNEGELYDLLKDPGELVNLWDAKSYRGMRNHMTAELNSWRGEQD
jgi:arylsulfatase